MNASRRATGGYSLMAAVVVAVVVCMAFFGTSPSWAQQKSVSLKKQMVGGWTISSVILEQGGKKIEPFGVDPKGFASFHPDGRFSYMIIRSDLPRIASGNRFTATPEEMKTIYHGTVAYYGRYSVDEKDGTLALHIEASTFTNWNGTAEKRQLKMVGDEMRLINLNPATGGTSYIVWKRVK